MKNSQKGSVLPVLLIVIVLLIIGGVYFYRNKIIHPSSQNKLTQQPPSTKSCDSKFIPPSSGTLNQQISITPNLFAISWYYKTQSNAEMYGIFTCQDGVWTQVYSPSDSSPIHNIMLTLLPNQSIFEQHIRPYTGFDEARTYWGVIHLQGNSWVFTTGETAQNQVLAKYPDFSGSNLHLTRIINPVADGKVSEQFVSTSGHVIVATYSWNGSAFSVLSVQSIQ